MANIQRTTISIVSAIPRKNASCAARGPSLTLPSANAYNSVNSTTGNSVPSAAALMGLSGMSPRIQVRIDSASAGGISIEAVARRRAVASGSSTSVLNHGGATTTVKIAQAIARPNIHPNAFAPTRPVMPVSPPPATPTMSSGTTSGMTVMRTALIHAVPTTSSTAISPRVNAEGDASCESHMPRARPSNRPSVT